MATASCKTEVSPVSGGALSMGHVALHYGTAKDGPLAARLLRLFGLAETQMIPLPNGNFYRFVVSENHSARGDGIVFLSCLPEAQSRLIAAIHEALQIGSATENPAVQGFRDMMAEDFEASFHFAFLVACLEELEALTLTLMELAEDDPAFKGRLTIGLNRAQRGDAAVDARLDASPVFAKATRYAYGKGGVQVFVATDLMRAGPLGDSMVFEFDFVFPDQPSHILSVVDV
jgi:hypothetical protein